MADRVVMVIPAKKTFARSSESNTKRVAAYARVSTASDEQMGTYGNTSNMHSGMKR